MSDKLKGLMTILVLIILFLVGASSKAGAIVVVVRPPVTEVEPGAVVIKPVSPVEKPPFLVRPPFAVRSSFNPFFLRLPVTALNPSPPFFYLNLLFENDEFISGVGAVQ
jgi:hypothetical protein